MQTVDFGERLETAAQATDAVLGRWLERMENEGRAPEGLIAATRHALLGGGKRFRPFLVLECARVFGRADAAAEAVGAAFECVHAYSLVHDDLPAMDDDDMRRGRPTVHKAFDEATAILVGDGLQALAFQILAAPPVPDALCGRLVTTLADGAGFAGMVSGQHRDLCGPGDDEASVRLMQAQKTGALIAAACRAGAIVGGAAAADETRLVRFGTLIGEAFQLADDLLDLEGTAAETGKAVGKDAALGKPTLAALVGVERSRTRLAQLVAQASELAGAYGSPADGLVAACRFVKDRRR